MEVLWRPISGYRVQVFTTILSRIRSSTDAARFKLQPMPAALIDPPVRIAAERVALRCTEVVKLLLQARTRLCAMSQHIQYLDLPICLDSAVLRLGRSPLVKVEVNTDPMEVAHANYGGQIVEESISRDELTSTQLSVPQSEEGLKASYAQETLPNYSCGSDDINEQVLNRMLQRIDVLERRCDRYSIILFLFYALLLLQALTTSPFWSFRAFNDTPQGYLSQVGGRASESNSNLGLIGWKALLAENENTYALLPDSTTTAPFEARGEENRKALTSRSE
ncbi:hypothetical protein HDU67_009349, partial [Dinochytrium kinnereticum]